MGFLKHQMEDQEAQGWSFSDKFVCSRCVSDYALEEEIVSCSEPEHRCDFCGSSPAAEMDVLLAAFVTGLMSEYGDANDEGVSYEGREGGYQWHRKWNTWDLIDDFWDVLVGPGLIEAVKEAVHDRVWVERDFAWPRKDEALQDAWERFSHVVKHQRRYVLWLKEDPAEVGIEYGGEIPVHTVLDEIGTMLEKVGAVAELPAGSRFWRAHPHPENRPPKGTGKRLGTAPVEESKRANRMSPAGIALFYGSEDLETAAAEVAGHSDEKFITAGLFQTSEGMTIVDLTKLEAPPSMFDEKRSHLRRPLLFLHRFVEEVSKPARPEWEQLDYVPTQVMTEYLLHIFFDGKAVKGFLYPSAQTGRPSVVLQVPNEDCCDIEPGQQPPSGPPRLGLVEAVTQALP